MAAGVGQIAHAVWIGLLICVTAEENSVWQQPGFEIGNKTNNLLASDEVWVPVTTTLVTMRMVDEPLNILVKLQQVPASFGEPELFLMYKCSSSKTEGFEEAELYSGLKKVSGGRNNMGAFGRPLCKQRQPFSIWPMQNQSNRFALKLINSNGQINFDESLSLSAELAIRVRYNGAQLTSASLLIFNWDSLASKAHETGFVLTADGFNYISHQFYYRSLNYNSISRVNLLSNKFCTLVKSAPLFVQSHLTLTVTVRYNSSSCSEPWKPNTDIVLSSGDHSLNTDRAYSNLAFFKPIYFLDLNSGKLEVNLFTMSNMVTDAIHFRRTPAQSFLSCLRISTRNGALRYHAQITVPKRTFPVSLIPIHIGSVFTSNLACKTSHRSIDVRLISGMRDVLLKVPIICTRFNAIHRLFFNGTVCVGKLENGFRNCGHYFASELGTSISLSGPISSSHAGIYTFLAGQVIFSYVVFVISPPLFNSETQSGTLRPNSVVTELVELFNLTCTTFQSGVSPVTITPSFEVYIDWKLRKMASHEFMTFLGTDPQNLMQTRNETYNSSSLQLYMPYVEKPGDRPNTFAVVCRTTITADVTNDLFGTSVQYSTETRAIVHYDVQVRKFRYAIKKLISSISSIDYILFTMSLCFAATAMNI